MLLKKMRMIAGINLAQATGAKVPLRVLVPAHSACFSKRSFRCPSDRGTQGMTVL